MSDLYHSDKLLLSTMTRNNSRNAISSHGMKDARLACSLAESAQPSEAMRQPFPVIDQCQCP